VLFFTQSLSTTLYFIFVFLNLQFSFLMITIRPSREDDIPAITEIYNYYVLNSTCTFEITPLTIDEMASRRTDVLEKNMPYLVAELADSIIGYADCNWYKPRAAYRFSAESTIYLISHMCGKGFGRHLLDALGKRHFVPTFHCDLPEEMFVTIYRHTGCSE
jgi:L-amino acid N-acyltransferase YncA